LVPLRYLTDTARLPLQMDVVDTRLRLPADLHQQLAELAKQEQRSIHNLMLLLLRRGVADMQAGSPK